MSTRKRVVEDKQAETLLLAQLGARVLEILREANAAGPQEGDGNKWTRHLAAYCVRIDAAAHALGLLSGDQEGKP